MYIDTWAWGFPGGSGGKESAFNAGDPDSTPGLRRSPGEGNGNISIENIWKDIVYADECIQGPAG